MKRSVAVLLRCLLYSATSICRSPAADDNNSTSSNGGEGEEVNELPRWESDGYDYDRSLSTPSKFHNQGEDDGETNPRNRRNYLRKYLAADDKLASPFPPASALITSKDDEEAASPAASLSIPSSLLKTHSLAVSLFGPTAVERPQRKPNHSHHSFRCWKEPHFSRTARQALAEFEALRDGHFCVFSTETSLQRLNVEQMPELRALVHMCRTVASADTLLKCLGRCFATLPEPLQRSAALRLMIVKLVQQRHFDQAADVLSACVSVSSSDSAQLPEVSFRDVSSFLDAVHLHFKSRPHSGNVQRSACKRVIDLVEQFSSAPHRKLHRTLCDSMAPCDAPLLAMVGLSRTHTWKETIEIADRVRRWNSRLVRQGGDRPWSSSGHSYGVAASSATLSPCGWAALLTAAHRCGAPLDIIQSRIVDVAAEQDINNLSNIALWNAYINAVDDWGHALELYETNLPHYSLMPNAGTFAALMRCCLRNRQIDEAVRMYRAMRSRCVVMTMESAAVMFDVLAAAGKGGTAVKEHAAMVAELRLSEFLPPKNRLPWSVERAARRAMTAGPTEVPSSQAAQPPPEMIFY